MATAFCPTCGTEVDEEARFCPACGTTLREDDAPELPEAPAWPEPAEGPDEQLVLPGTDEHAEPTTAAPQPKAPAREEPGSAPAPAPAAQAAEPSPPPAAHPAPAPRGESDLPFSWPTTLSGWLIGGGSLLGAASLIASLSDAVSLLLMLALLGVAATVFVADRLPAIPRLRLINLSVAMVGLGVALERAGFGARGADSVLLVAMIAAAGGAVLIELDRDRPVNPPG